MSLLKKISAALVGLIIILFVYSLYLSRPIFDVSTDQKSILSNLSLAPMNEVITLAKSNDQVLLVTELKETGLFAVNLSQASSNIDTSSNISDTIDAYLTLGPERIRDMAVSEPKNFYIWSQLGIPVNQSDHPHVAVGTNYQAHADEVGHVEAPFLFPKLSKMTPWNAPVKDAPRLDYEVELCAVPMTDHTRTAPAKMAYLLCGDFTDRWALMMEMDIGAPKGPTGFPAGKGGPTRLPVGFLIAFPDQPDFYKNIQLDLYLNGELRQHSNTNKMIWNVDQALTEALNACEEPYFLGKDTLNLLPDCQSIPARTLLLTGTPEGILFRLPTIWNPMAYLQSGDQVISRADYLGFTHNTVQ